MVRDDRVFNTYKVPRKVWNKWTIVGKHVFNKTFALAMSNPEFFRATKADPVPPEHFRVTAWNFSFVAADTASKGTIYLLKQLTRELKGDQIED